MRWSASTWGNERDMRSILFVFLFIYSTREGKNLVVVACRLTLRYIQGDETIKYEFVVDKEKAMLYGIAPQQIVYTLNSALSNSS